MSTRVRVWCGECKGFHGIQWTHSLKDQDKVLEDIFKVDCGKKEFTHRQIIKEVKAGE